MQTDFTQTITENAKALDLAYQQGLLRTIPPMAMGSLHRYFFDMGARAQRDIDASEPHPAIIIEVSGGLIQSTRANGAMRVVILDGDVEGADGDRVNVIEGEEACVSDYILDGSDPIENVLHEVDRLSDSTQDKPEFTA